MADSIGPAYTSVNSNPAETNWSVPKGTAAEAVKKGFELYDARHPEMTPIDSREWTHDKLGDFWEGVKSYPRGVGRFGDYLWRLAGAEGEEQARAAKAEGEMLLDGIRLIKNEPAAREATREAAWEYFTRNPTRVIGRVATGSAVSFALSTRLNIKGTILGLGLTASAAAGDLLHGIKNGIESLNDAARAVLGGE